MCRLAGELHVRGSASAPKRAQPCSAGSRYLLLEAPQQAAFQAT